MGAGVCPAAPAARVSKTDPAKSHKAGTRERIPSSVTLVPRTRSSHHNCRESDCELRVQSGTRIIDLLVSFDSEVRLRACGKLGRTSESGHWIKQTVHAASRPSAIA